MRQRVGTVFMSTDAKNIKVNKSAQQLGTLGGKKTASLYGKEHFKKIVKGWPKGKRRNIIFPAIVWELIDKHYKKQEKEPVADWLEPKSVSKKSLMARNCPIFLNCFLRKIKAFISGQPSRKVACGAFFDTLLALTRQDGAGGVKNSSIQCSLSPAENCLSRRYNPKDTSCTWFVS